MKPSRFAKDQIIKIVREHWTSVPAKGKPGLPQIWKNDRLGSVER